MRNYSVYAKGPLNESSSMKHAVFFIHGGPGLNSFAENAILGPLLAKEGSQAYFWNEPSSLRPNGKFSSRPRNFQTWLAALEDEFSSFSAEHGKIHIVAHSFGAHGAVYLSHKFSNQIAQITLVAPGLETYECQKNVSRLCIEDFKISAPEKAKLLERYLLQSRTVFDQFMAQAFQLALQNEKLMTHYWVDRAKMLAWAVHLGSAEAQMDIESLFGIPSTFDTGHLDPDKHPVSAIPVLILFAEIDPVITRQKETALARILFQDMREVTILRTSHFLHLEQPEEFVQSISKDFRIT